MSKKIPLGNSDLFAIVSDRDYERVSKYKWHAGRQRKENTFYASRSKYMPNNRIKNKTISMHRFILRAKKGEIVDHINHFNETGKYSTLDNRRCNLRKGTYALNSLNRKRNKKFRSSKYKGVMWNKFRNKWMACFKHKYLGYFDTEKEASISYNRAAKKFNKDWVLLNEN